MGSRSKISTTAAAVMLAWLMSASVAVQASGWGRTPSSMCQFFGYGYGRGYHAPIVYRVRRTPQLHGSPGYYAAPWGAHSEAAAWSAPMATPKPMTPDYESIDAPPAYPAPQ